LESATTYYGYEADSVNSSLMNKGVKKLEKNFFEFFQDTYPNLSQIGDIKINSVPDEAKVTVTVKYNLGQAWVENEQEEYEGFEAYPTDVSSYTPDFKGGERDMPYSLSHPRHSRHKLIFKLDESWDLAAYDIKINNEAFNFRKKTTFKGGVYTEDYSYKTKQDFISAATFTQTMADVNKLNDELGVELTNGTDWLNQHSDYVFLAFVLYICLASIGIFIGVIVLDKVDRDWEKDQLFYPVKLSKFLFLSTLSFGFYSVLWGYKNWRWIRNIGGENIRPFWRTFFMGITNFILLPKFVDPDNEGKGYPWYSAALGVLLAVLYLALEVIGYLEDGVLPASFLLMAFSLFSFIAFIPSVMQVNRLNLGRDDIIVKNSTYRWETIVFILLFIPIWGGVLYSYLS